ncbi:BTB/POZ domain-containing protein DOT3 isoform X2 [Olea europaea var. sylvestris]|uniref:BTB/POZ domain-containing protein DOT3 isoform X2 n=1 Tax=Olea europaea var. sylvestris TaxID=158386 RepID=UPI000C1D74AD|nr:BTB/POZ domain-containing protein DOT3 isoform X2 [Olea europaea var. sylvestris]
MQQDPEKSTMKLSIQPQSLASASDGPYEVQNRSIVVPEKLITKADGFEKKEHSWFAISQIPTDLSIQVQDITFYVHKFPLVSRCGYFGRIELQPPNSNLRCDLKLENFPGGSETFEAVLKFCYGLPISLNPNNVAPLRCASEFLEMTEALEDGNLISKAEAFFTFVVLSSWKDSITVLKSCETLSPWAENLQIVRRCCDSIAWKASRQTSTTQDIINEEMWWFNDVATLRIDHFTRIITALRAKGMRPEIIGSCIMQYGEKWLPSLEVEIDRVGRFSYGKNELQWNITNGRTQEGDIGPIKEQRTIIESLVSILPPQKEAVSCKFLSKMLKVAIVYSASPALVSELEKRIGLMLENANVNDLLIPSYTAGDEGELVNSMEGPTMHNINIVQRILEYFLLYEQQQQQQQQPQKPGMLAIGKLLDSYLAEIAKDPNLPVTNFQVLAESLPENARACDDGLYRAIDTYLKTRPSLSEHERRRLCKVMDCEKLSLDACAHAAQNDRLPLRTVIQVLFSEQAKLRMEIQGKNQTESDDISEQEVSWSSTKKEVRSLKAELEKVKSQMAELQKDYSELQQEYEKLIIKQRNSSGWILGWRKIRKSALFHTKMDEEDTDESHNRKFQNQRGSLRRRQSIA